VNPITPNKQTTTPLRITAASTGDVTPDNVTLWYRWGGLWKDDFFNKGNVSSYHTMTFSNGNVTVNQSGLTLKDYVDNNLSNVDGVSDEGTHSNFNNEKNKDGLYDVLKEGNTNITDFVDVISNVDNSPDQGTHSNFANEKNIGGGYDVLTEKNTSLDIKDSVDSDTSNVDPLADNGTEINFPNAQEITPDSDVMTITEANQVTPAASDTLHCNNYDGTTTDWSTSGSSPYLNADDSANINTKTSGATEAWFNFPDTSITGSSAVYINVKAWGDGDDWADVYVDYTGGSGTDRGNVGLHTSEGTYDNISIDVLTQNQINSLRIKFVYQRSGTRNYLYVDHVYLWVHRAATTNYHIDFEYQWTSAEHTLVNKKVCLYVASHSGNENLRVSYWTGSTWSVLGTITGTGWSNYTATGLTSSLYTIRLNGTSEISDTQQDSWTIDCMFLHTWSLNYSLDLEVQWTSVDFSETNEYLCIRTGTLDSESLKVEVRTGSTWTPLIAALQANQWNNVSVSSYLTSGMFTIRFLGSIETGDTTQSSWNIDCSLLHLWSMNYALNLEVQWTNADFSQSNEEVCINMGAGANLGSLDATGGYMRIGDGSPDWGSQKGTISFWIKCDSLSGNPRPWGQHTDMEIKFSGSQMVVDWGGSTSLSSNTNFVNSKWYFVAISWNESSNHLVLYVGDDSTLPIVDTNEPWTGSVSTLTGSMQNTFMASHGSNPMDGHGDDLRYWNIDRTLTQIQNDYKTELTGSEPNLRSYFKLNSNLDDIGPNNNDGSGSGSYSFSSDVPSGMISVSSENIRVDVWNTSTSVWYSLFPNLVSGWNNASVHPWLTSSTFTIRYTDESSSSDTIQDSWLIDAALLHLWSTIYQGDLTSKTISKPMNCNWSKFNAELNNTANSTFRILDQYGNTLLSNLKGNNNDISAVTVNTIRLFGSFNGSVKLNSWSVSNSTAWKSYGMDSQGSDGWSWSFTFPFPKVTYWFYSIGRKTHFSNETAPVNPSYDTECKYWP
jgi:hypothetical protein